MSRTSWGTIAGDFSGSGASLSPEPQPDDKNHVLYQYLGACAILLLGVVFMLNYVRGGRQRKPRADPRAENALLDPGPFECAKQQPERSAAPLPAGLQLAAAAPRVVSQTYLVIEVAAFHGLLNRHSQAEITLHGAENSIQWTVQRRIGAFTSLAFTEGLSNAATGAVARLGRWPTGAKHDPHTVEAQRQYADGWFRAVAGAGAAAWDSVALRDFVAYDEHEQQLEALCVGESPGKRSPTGLQYNKQYLTDSGGARRIVY